MKQKLSLVVAVFSFLLFPLFGGDIANSAPALKGTIEIGVLFPRTGPLAILGEEVFRGVEIARIMRNKKGGLWGKEVVYIVEDAPNAEAGVSAATRLIKDKGLKVIMGSYASGIAFAASEVAERNKVIHWEVSGAADDITKRGYKYVFRHSVAVSDFGTKAVEYSMNLVAPKINVPPEKIKVVVMYEDTLYGTTVGESAMKVAKEKVQLLASENYSAKTLDLSSLVLKFKSLNPDVVIATSYLNDAILFFRQSKELGFSPKAFFGTGAGYGHTDFPKALGDDVNGVFNIDPYLNINPRGLTPEARKTYEEFLKIYRDTYKKEPDTRVGMGFSGATALLEYVLPKAGSLDPDKIREAALSLDMPVRSFTMGYGAKFAPPGHPMAGHNLRTFPCLAQYQGQELVVVYPSEYATSKAVVPLPPWGMRKDLGK